MFDFFFLVIFSLLRLRMGWFLLFLLPTLLFLLHLILFFFLLFRGMEEVCLLSINSAVCFCLPEDLNSVVENSASVNCYPKKTQLPLNLAPSSIRPSLLFTKSHAVLSDLVFHRGHVFSSCSKNTKVRICFLKSLNKFSSFFWCFIYF